MSDDVTPPDPISCGCLLLVVGLGLAYVILCARIGWAAARWAWEADFSTWFGS